MIRPQWLQLFLDVPRATFAKSVAFWSAATGWAPSAIRGEQAQFCTLVPTHGESFVTLQAIDGGPRIHLDLDGSDRPGLLRRAHELGATPAWQYADVPVLHSPGGLLFCLTLAGQRPRLGRGATSLLDQVCLDIPATAWDAEVEFWRELTGRTLTAGRMEQFVRLNDPAPDGPLRLLLQRTDDDRATVGAHPDFAVAHRAAERERHRRLGATVVAEHAAWTIMSAPDGLTYCLTDRDPLTGLVAG